MRENMNKKIIILNGSPRKNGNTSALTAAFTKGAEEAVFAWNGYSQLHELFHSDKSEKDVHSCRGVIKTSLPK